MKGLTPIKYLCKDITWWKNKTIKKGEILGTYFFLYFTTDVSSWLVPEPAKNLFHVFTHSVNTEYLNYELPWTASLFGKSYRAILLFGSGFKSPTNNTAKSTHCGKMLCSWLQDPLGWCFTNYLLIPIFHQGYTLILFVEVFFSFILYVCWTSEAFPWFCS